MSWMSSGINKIGKGAKTLVKQPLKGIANIATLGNRNALSEALKKGFGKRASKSTAVAPVATTQPVTSPNDGRTPVQGMPGYYVSADDSTIYLPDGSSEPNYQATTGHEVGGPLSSAGIGGTPGSPADQMARYGRVISDTPRIASAPGVMGGAIGAAMPGSLANVVKVPRQGVAPSNPGSMDYLSAIKSPIGTAAANVLKKKVGAGGQLGGKGGGTPAPAKNPSMNYF
jgi:hypothetical protein